MKKTIYLFFFTGLLTISFSANSQEVTGSAGEYFEGNDLSISWTIGETLTETFESNNLILTQGMHQPIISVTDIEWYTAKQLDFDVYPNPTANFLFIKKPFETTGVVKYKIHSTSGANITNGFINNELNEIDFSKLPNQLYIIKFYEKGKIIGQCKVVKK